MANVGVRGVSIAVSQVARCGVVSRGEGSYVLSTDVSEEISPSVPHPLGTVDARLRLFRSASFRIGPGGSLSSSA
jgi:hypothetical protein